MKSLVLMLTTALTAGGIPLVDAAAQLKSGAYYITQSWSQETAFKRPYYVSVPESTDQRKFPVFIFLHGHGGKRCCHTDDLVPYRGGPSKYIPAKDSTLGFVDAEESIFLWAKQMGYDGEKLSKPSRSDGNLEIFSYLNGDVIHYKVINEGHGAGQAISEKILLEFLEGGDEREK